MMCLSTLFVGHRFSLIVRSADSTRHSPARCSTREGTHSRSVPARIPGIEEQAVLVLVANVPLQVDSGSGRDRDRSPTAQETLDPRRVFPHALFALSTFQRVSSLSRI